MTTKTPHADLETRSRGLVRSPIARVAGLGFGKPALSLSASLLFIFAATGCDVCGDLDERMCKDLGAEDCAVWKENKMTFSDQSNSSGGGGRRSGLKKLLFGDGSGVCSSADSDAVYPQMLSSMKQAVGAMRQAKQATEAAGK